MSMGGGYSPSLAGAFTGGAPASVGGNVTTENRNAVAAGAATSSGTLHVGIGVIVAAIVILALGRGWLRNARIA